MRLVVQNYDFAATVVGDAPTVDAVPVVQFRVARNLEVCMKKTDVIEVLERLKAGTKGVVAATISDCQKVIGDMENDGWIPVSERKPKKVVDERGKMIFFLGFTQEYGVRVVSYMPPVDVWNWLSLPVDVTYWMPLPVPPEEVLP